MLKREKHESKKEKNRENRKNVVLYLIVFFMLFYSIVIYFENKNLSVEAGNFDGGVMEKNVSFYQAGKKLFCLTGFYE
jgi:hypothetical protein